MILVAIAWLYVVLMVAVVEATSERGSALGALFTFALYGVLPLSIVLYLMLSPARRRARRAAEAWVQPTEEVAAPSPEVSALGDPDQRRHAPGDAVAPKREEA